MSRSRAAATSRLSGPDVAVLSVDPVACDGIGMCAYLAPGLIQLDSWGFPIVQGRLSGRVALRAARAAVGGCPRQALHLDEQR